MDVSYTLVRFGFGIDRLCLVPHLLLAADACPGGSGKRCAGCPAHPADLRDRGFPFELSVANIKQVFHLGKRRNIIMKDRGR